jgi:hypothetical protein
MEHTIAPTQKGPDEKNKPPTLARRGLLVNDRFHVTQQLDGYSFPKVPPVLYVSCGSRSHPLFEGFVE